LFVAHEMALPSGGRNHRFGRLTNRLPTSGGSSGRANFNLEQTLLLFRVFVSALCLVLVGYTAVVISAHGIGLFPIFFGDMAALAWPGQFNLDFMFMLSLSALWVSWRHQFSAVGLALGLLAFLGGALFLTVYLFVLSFQTKGDAREILLGPHRGVRS